MLVGLVCAQKFARWNASTTWPLPICVPPRVYIRGWKIGEPVVRVTALAPSRHGSLADGSYTWPVSVNVSAIGTIWVGTVVDGWVRALNTFLPTMLTLYFVTPAEYVCDHIGTDGA